MGLQGLQYPGSAIYHVFPLTRNTLRPLSEGGARWAVAASRVRLLEFEYHAINVRPRTHRTACPTTLRVRLLPFYQSRLCAAECPCSFSLVCAVNVFCFKSVTRNTVSGGGVLSAPYYSSYRVTSTSSPNDSHHKMLCAHRTVCGFSRTSDRRTHG